MIISILRSQKGIALISVYLASLVITTMAGAAYSKSLYEMRQIEREIDRLQSYAAAEAGIQAAMAQISVNAYTGFINATPFAVGSFQAVDGTEAGSFQVQIDYPNQADWVIVSSTGNNDTETRQLEARIFLDSNLSKYLVYADTGTFSSGDNAQYGNHDGVSPKGTPSNEDDRAGMYFTGVWNLSGSNVTLYGDAHAENRIDTNNSSDINGDTYASSFTMTGGTVTNDGVYGGGSVGDGFDDDADRNGDGIVNATDKPDFHDLTTEGTGDAHAREELVDIDHNFYQTHNNIPAFGSSTASRYVEFVPSPGGGSTQVIEYDSASYQNQVQVYTLPSSAIVYAKGDIYVKGEIQGRVSVVSGDDILIKGDISYTNGQKHADPTHSTAFLAKDVLYFLPNQLEVSGILYAEAASGTSTAMDSGYNQNLQYDPNSKEYLRLYGNRVIHGSSNLGNYDDRVYGYDQNLKYYRPPGIPVVPDLRTVRETT